MFSEYKNQKRFFHFLMIISFMIVLSTAFAAAYLFSKEAIITSFENSFHIIGLNGVSADDKMLIARLERRITWDWHFFSGLIASFSFFVLLTISLIGKTFQKNKKYYLFFGPVLLILFLTGVWMYSRIYFPISKELFSDLKSVHNFMWKIFLIQAAVHIFMAWTFKIKPAIDSYINPPRGFWK